MTDFRKGLVVGTAGLVAWVAASWVVANLGLSAIFGVLALGPLGLGVAAAVPLAKRRRALAAGIGVALLAALVVLAGWIWLFGQILRID